MPERDVTLVAYEIYAEAGLERSLVETIRRAEDVDWTVVSRSLAEELRSLVAWRRVPVPDRPFRVKLVTFGAAATIRALPRRGLLHVVGPILGLRPDLVTVQFLRSAFYSAIGAPLRGTTRLHVELEHRFLNRARMVAAPSVATARDLEAVLGDVPIRVVPNGVDVELFRPDDDARAAVRAVLGVPEDVVVAAFVGNGWRRKGLPETIRALGLAGDVELWVVGSGVPAEYAALVAAHAPERVRFLGVRRDVERVLAGADFFVLPSAYETFLIAAFEAAAAGLPVVATPVAGLEELIGNGEAGVLVERSPEAIAEAMSSLAGDPSRRASLGAAARRRAMSFTWDRSVAKLLALYDELRSGRN